MNLKKLSVSIFLVILVSLFTGSSFAVRDNKPTIYAPNAILIESLTGEILYEKNAYDRKYPASTTKIMTALIVLENCKLDEKVVVGKNALSVLEGSGYVIGHLRPGEHFTVKQLLDLLMVASANDAAIVLAEHVSGSVKEFCKLMNKKAKSLGCDDTNFVNPNGLHDKDHYSSAYDLALIAKEAMKHPEFRKIVVKLSCKLPATDKYKQKDRVFTNINQLIIPNDSDTLDNYYYTYATGIKTGFTTPAGDCLVASSEKDSLEFIAVVLNAKDTKSGLSERYLDTKALFNYGYQNYELRTVAVKRSAYSDS